MAALSTYQANKTLEHTLGRTPYTPPSTFYLALYTNAPTAAGGGTEVAGNGYQRVPLSWAAAASGAMSNSSTITFPTATGVWGTIVATGIWDSISGGNFISFGSPNTQPTVSGGDTVSFAIGQITVTLV